MLVPFASVDPRTGAAAVSLLRDLVATYAALADRVERLADGLAGRGVRRGDRVAFLGHNDIATFEVFFATCRLGAIFTPYNVRLAAPEIAYLIDDSAPTVLVHGPETADLVAAVDPAAHGVAATVSLSADGPGGYAALLAEAEPRSVRRRAASTTTR